MYMRRNYKALQKNKKPQWQLRHLWFAFQVVFYQYFCCFHPSLEKKIKAHCRP